MNKNRQEVVTQLRETHRANLQRSLQRRLEVARANGDENLVRKLEEEAKYLG